MMEITPMKLAREVGLLLVCGALILFIDTILVESGSPLVVRAIAAITVGITFSDFTNLIFEGGSE